MNVVPAVLFLGGLGRSGTTLVERVLARAPGVVAVGELVFLWERGVHLDERCGCGTSFGACPFWEAVGRRAFGGWDVAELQGVRELQRRVDRTRYVPLLLAPWIWPPFRDRLRRYAELVGRVYGAVAAESGAAVIVDSSKHVSTAALLRHVPGIRPRVVQLVRDPRGVAYSWSKDVERPDAEGSRMAMLGPWRIAARWVTHDLLLELVRPRRGGGRLRYEGFVADPEAVARHLLDVAGLAPTSAPAIGAGGTVALVTDHTVAGNPLRFRTGEVEIRADVAWRERMPAADRRVVGALTYPLRVAYGYR
jgi:hypothetical protein